MRCFWLVPTLCMTVLALTRQSYRCGVGPHSLSLQSQRSKSLIVYQINGSQIILLTNITAQPKGSGLNWIIIPGESDLSRLQLLNLSHRFPVRTYRKTGQTYTNISFTSELEGVGVRLRLRPPNGSNQSTLSTLLVKLCTGASPIILLSESVLSAILPGQNIVVCGNISGIPPPLITIVRTQDQRKVDDSLYNYDGKCWTLDSSAVKNGGQFTIVAKNCLSITNATFSIEVGPPKISLNQSQPYVIGSKDNVSVCGNISGISSPYIYTVLIQTSEQIKISSSFYKYDGNCWTIDNSVVKDGGRFTIEIRSKLSSASANASFLVMVKPAISMNFTMVAGGCLDSNCSPPLLVALQGQNVAIPYAMMGFPTPTTELINTNHNQSLYDEVKSNLGKISSTHLLLGNVSSADSGIYRFSLRNAVGSDIQNFDLEIVRRKEVIDMCLTSSNTKGTCSLQLPTENLSLLSRGKPSASVAERALNNSTTATSTSNSISTSLREGKDDIPLWAYIVMGIAFFVLFALIATVLAVKFCRIGKSNFDQHIGESEKSNSWLHDGPPEAASSGTTTSGRESDSSGYKDAIICAKEKPLVMFESNSSTGYASVELDNFGNEDYTGGHASVEKVKHGERSTDLDLETLDTQASYDRPSRTDVLGTNTSQKPLDTAEIKTSMGYHNPYFSEFDFPETDNFATVGKQQNSEQPAELSSNKTTDHDSQDTRKRSYSRVDLLNKSKKPKSKYVRVNLKREKQPKKTEYCHLDLSALEQALPVRPRFESVEYAEINAVQPKARENDN